MNLLLLLFCPFANVSRPVLARGGGREGRPQRLPPPFEVLKDSQLSFLGFPFASFTSAVHQLGGGEKVELQLWCWPAMSRVPARNLGNLGVFSISISRNTRTDAADAELCLANKGSQRADPERRAVYGYGLAVCTY